MAGMMKPVSSSRFVILETGCRALESPEQTDESSPGSDETTPSVLQTGCTVAWSNAVYRSEVRSSASDSTSSSSQERSVLTGGIYQSSWTGRSISAGKTELVSGTEAPRLEAVNMEVQVTGSTTAGDATMPRSFDEFLDSINSTRKVLADLPAFQEDCTVSNADDEQDVSVSRQGFRVAEEIAIATSTVIYEQEFSVKVDELEHDEEVWVHGPERNLENELELAAKAAELEDEAESKLEAQLRSDIAALSHKLTKLHTQRDQQAGAQSDPSLKVRKAQVKQEPPRRAVKTADCNKPRSKVAVSKQRVEVEKLQPDRAAFEEQLKTLRLSPHFWGKNFDWAKSLRSGAAPAKAPPRKEAASRNVLVENNRERKADGNDRLKQKTQLKENVNRKNMKEPPAQSTQAGAWKSKSSPSKLMKPPTTGLPKKAETKGKPQGRVIPSRAFAHVPSKGGKVFT